MTFTDRSIDALKAYLRTAAVIDDAALATQPKEPAPATTLQTPGRGAQASQQPEGPKELKGAFQDVPALVDAFLEQEAAVSKGTTEPVVVEQQESNKNVDESPAAPAQNLDDAAAAFLLARFPEILCRYSFALHLLSSPFRTFSVILSVIA